MEAFRRPLSKQLPQISFNFRACGYLNHVPDHGILPKKRSTTYDNVCLKIQTYDYALDAFKISKNFAISLYALNKDRDNFMFYYIFQY